MNGAFVLAGKFREREVQSRGELAVKTLPRGAHGEIGEPERVDRSNALQGSDLRRPRGAPVAFELIVLGIF